MTRSYLGIDPGKDGALVLLCPDEAPVVWRTSDMLVKDGGKTRYVPERMVEALVDARGRAGGSGLLTVVLESVHAHPGEGVSSAFAFGLGLGLWRGAVAALGLTCVEPTPQAWQRVALEGIPGADAKARAVLLAEQAQGLKLRRGKERKAHAGVADAHGLAVYGLRTFGRSGA